MLPLAIAAVPAVRLGTAGRGQLNVIGLNTTPAVTHLHGRRRFFS